MIANPPVFEKVRTFSLNDIHKKYGRIVVYEPTDSDLADGINLKIEVWFVDYESSKIYLLVQEKQVSLRVIGVS